MAYEPGGSDRREELVAVIRRVRNRWRLKLALRGAVIVVAGTLLALLLSASSLEALRFSPTAIIAFRAAALSPITRICAAVGPMNAMLLAAHVSANSAFSARNPYPG